MGGQDHFVLGDYNAICHECARKRKASTMKKHWKGYYVCADCWEPRHPQDFVKAPPAEQPVPWSQPPTADIFIDDGAPEAEPYVPPGWDDPTT